jgi:site-specific recombinase XerD
VLPAPTPTGLPVKAVVPRRKLARDILTTAEVEALIAACSRRAPTGIRSAALIATLWRCGLRSAELLALHPTDVDLDRGLLHVLHGKGGRSRWVGLDPGTAALIARWLDARQKLIGRRHATLYCTLQGGKIDTSQLRRTLPRLAARAGIQKRVHAHGLRHRFALDLDAEGASLTTIRDLLGHASAATTDAYLRRVGAGDAVAFARDRTWPESITPSH